MTKSGRSTLSNMNSRKWLQRFNLNFFVINILLSLLISINYFPLLPHFQNLAGGLSSSLFIWFFFSISFIAQFAFLFLVCFLISNLFITLFPQPFIMIVFAVTLASALSFALLADSITFNLYHMHYAIVGWELFKAHAFSQVISFSLYEIAIFIIAGFLLLLIESFIAWIAWKCTKNIIFYRWNCILIIIFMFCLITSYSLTFMAREWPGRYYLSNNDADLIVKASRFIPYYDELYQFIIPTEHTYRHVETQRGSIDFLAQQSHRLLNYPLHSITIQASKPALNIVVIVIDTWRYDAMNATITPTIYEFAKHALQFQDHWSGGNCTKAGLFSLFYSLPENYWQAVLEQQRGPEFIHQLIQAHYNMGIFASAQLNFPAFDQTIFREIKPLTLYTAGTTTVARDQTITQRFKQFLASRNKHQPFFSFIFYDDAHNYCEPVTPQQHPFNPWKRDCNRLALTIHSNPEPYLNRYRNAVYFIDTQIKQVLAELKQQHLMQNTIVIITGDHGEEINDQQSGYWEHASAYTSYQLHVPFIMYWPGLKPSVYTHFTTHYDFTPTLMTLLLHSKNPTEDYSVGRSLFEIGHRPILISGSYADYAVISKHQIVRIYRGGDYEVDDARGKPIEQAVLQLPALKQALSYLKTYFN